MPTLFDTRRTLIPFKTALLPQIFCDTLIIGGGVAGLRAAIATGPTAGAPGAGGTIVLCKDEPQVSNTAWAQGGIAAVTAENDTVESHIHDTLVAGAGLCDKAMVEQVVSRGPARIAELLQWGIRFDKDTQGHLKLGLEGGHSLHRILHAYGDATGKELFRCLWEKTNKTPGVRVFTRCFTLDLLTDAQNDAGSGSTPSRAATLTDLLGATKSRPAVRGALTHHPKYGYQVIWANRTILAAGGAGVVYRETTNPRTATGDGIAMAYRAGTAVADMAFIQFHPTCLYLAGAPRSLITEAIRGEGGLLIDQQGKRFMPDVHPMGELAPRDVVTKGIVEHLSKHGGGTHVFLDCRHIKNFNDKFPGIAELLRRYELDAARDPIPVHPGQHYTIGGVVTDLRGRTSLPGLWAIGEVACSGLHGANRLASNSLLEGLVMGEIAGRDTADQPATGRLPAPVPMDFTVPPSDAGDLDLADAESSLRSAMWRNVGIERNGPRLRSSVDMIEFWGRYTLDKVFDDHRGWQVQNMLTVARLIASSALAREESRGAHWRSDFPDPSVIAEHDCTARTRM